jgi:hypothetical protein
MSSSVPACRRPATKILFKLLEAIQEITQCALGGLRTSTDSNGLGESRVIAFDILEVSKDDFNISRS